MSTAKSEIRQLYDTLAQTFSRLDLDAFRQNFHLPCQIVSDQGVRAIADRADFDTTFGALMDGLRAQGFVRSAVLHQHIALLGTATALASVSWVRYRANDEELERIGATYTLTRAAAGWRIAAIVAHAPECVLAIEQP